VTFAAATAGAAAALAWLAAAEASRPVASRLRGLGARGSRPSPLARAIRALGSRPLVQRLRPPKDLSARLAAGGDPGGLRPREWVAVKACSAAAATVPAVVVVAGGPGRVAVLLALAAPLAGFVVPELWLARAVRARCEAAVRDLPDMLDLLRVAVAGGVAPIRAMGDVAGQFDGPLAAEWRRVAVAAALGEPRAAALERLRERLPAAEVVSFADAFVRAQHHGLPLGPTLAAQASKAREARRRRIRERAARAAPKMQLVVALVLVPSMLLIVAALLIAELEPGLGWAL
jgi:tight adherence protein C